MRQLLTRGLALAAPFLFAVACQSGPDDLAIAPNGSLVEAIAGTGGEAGRVSSCGASGSCQDLAVGDLIEPGRLVVEGGTSARIAVGGMRLGLSQETELVLGEGWSIEEGEVAIEVDPENEARLRVGDHMLSFAKGRPSSVSVSRAGERATVVVHRGKLEIERAVHGFAGGSGELLTLSRGQSAELVEERAVARYEPSALSTAALREQNELPLSEQAAVRGLGRMTARRPGTEAVVGGVVLAKHDVSVVIRDGVASTTIEEVFENETNQVLEGRFVFPMPASASISDLVLWVGDTPTSAEMVEKRRAAAIFKGIVDDTVRPRDPALLEWAQGREVSLKIFPIEARSSRRVRFTFEEPVSDLGGRGRFVVPLSAGADRATRIKDFSLRVRVEGAGVSDVATPRYAARVDTGSEASEVSFTAQGFAPANDFVLTYRSEAAEAAVLIGEPDDACAGDRRVCPPVLEGASVVRTLLGAADAGLPAAIEADRVLVVDKSASQTPETLAAQGALVRRVLSTLDAGERFAILACDSACDAYPSDGLAAASPALVRDAGEWLARLDASGSSDLSGALSLGLARLESSEAAQLVVLGDGVPSAGDLKIDDIVERVAARAAAVDLRFVGAGRNVDELALRALARGLDGTFDALDPSADRDSAVGALSLSLSQPVLRDIEVDLPDGVSLAIDAPTALRLGDELRLATITEDRFDDGGELVVRGRLGGEDFEQRSGLVLREGPHGFASRSVARAQIDGLEMLGASGADELVIDLSKRFFVMSRQTSLLVLENDEMFKAFGIERTRGGRAVRVPAVRMGGSLDQLLAPWGSAEDLGLGARGNMWGNDIADSFGAGGLGLSGIGEGGGGIGLGSIGTIGRGAGTGTGQGFGSGDGRLGGEHRSKPPSVRMGSTSVSGRLPPEVIQRIVRQNFGRFRLCYESALRTNPNLVGRVTVSFVIGQNGSVSSARGNGSGINDSAMVACVVRSFAGLSFPQPEGGIVTVTYPIAFSPDGSQPSPPSSPFAPMPPQISNGDDTWVNRTPDVVTRLESDIARDGSKRSSRNSLVRALLARGRFPEAVTRATEYVAIDPDRAEPLELLAEALLASGEVDKALAVLDSTAEIDRDKAKSHRRIARAFEAHGDERRACAHWVSLASIEKNDSSRREAWRCRARALGETDTVALEIDRFLAAHPQASSAPLLSLLRSIKSASVGGYEWPAAGSDDVRVDLSCSSERASCPVLLTVDDRGRVVSDHLPDAEGRRFATTWSGGNYRALLVGGDANQSVTVSLTTQGHTKKTELRRAQRATALAARIEQPSFGWGRGIGGGR